MKGTKFCILIPSWNNEKFARKNIESALGQKYENFSVLYIDDNCTDATADVYNEFLDNNKFQVIKNKERKGAAYNLYNAPLKLDNDTVVVTLDGDDVLAHDEVLSRLDEEYRRGAWMTYGQHVGSLGTVGCAQEVPDDVIRRNAYRRYRWCHSHLRTYYAWLSKLIQAKDLKYPDGTWLPRGADLAIMFCIAEMCGSKAHYIPDVLYIYNEDNNLSDHVVDRQGQIQAEMYIRRKITPYQPLSR